jgi:hypothetical protein
MIHFVLTMPKLASPPPAGGWGQFGLAQALLRGDLRVRYLIFIHVLSSILWQLKRRVVFSKLFGCGGFSGCGPGGRRECGD